MISPAVACALVATVLAAAVLTRFAAAYAKRLGLIDVPNERSSHSEPTPRAGGLAIVVTSTAALGALAYYDQVPHDLLVAILPGGLAVAAIGFADDRYRVPPLFRLLVQLVAAIWALMHLGGLPPLQWGDRVVDLGPAGDLLCLVGMVWIVNLFNFMDGIDGIAASEAVFVLLAGALLAHMHGSSASTSTVAVVVGAASFGFLVWNWPPARIFLGDVGSGYLGFVIAGLALSAAHDNPVAPFIWLILSAVFFVDATVTLLRRLARGERVHKAHRTHAYQWLARRWRGHQTVTLMVLAINVLWLLPIAWYATLHPTYDAWCVALAFAPLIVLALVAGAGRSERAP